MTDTPSSEPSLSEVRELCEVGLADLPIPSPFSVEQLRINMERARGRRIIMQPIPDSLITASTACGLRIKDTGFSVILTASDRRPT